MLVREVMTTPVIAVDSTERLLEAFNIMRSHNFKHLIVVDNGKLVGLISDRDLLSHATRENGIYVFPRQTVHSIMVRNVITCSPNDPIEKALNLLLDNNISCLPVVEDGEVVGIVTSRSFLRQMKYKEGES